MKGVCLIVALATLGLDYGNEPTSDGNYIYTFRLEQVMLEPMRSGQSVTNGVDPKNRGLRRFQIALVEAAGSAVPNNLRVADTTELQYGWRPTEDGAGLEYLVQISPERFERLIKGTPIIGEVLPEVPEVRRFRISVGLGQLDRTGLTRPLEVEQPPSFLNPNATTPRTATDYESPSRFTIPINDGSSRTDGFTTRTDTGARRSSDGGSSQDRTASDRKWRTEVSDPSRYGNAPVSSDGRTQLVSNMEDPGRPQNYDNRSSSQNNYGNSQYGNNQYGNGQYGNGQYGTGQYGTGQYGGNRNDDGRYVYSDRQYSQRPPGAPANEAPVYYPARPTYTVAAAGNSPVAAAQPTTASVQAAQPTVAQTQSAGPTQTQSAVQPQAMWQQPAPTTKEKDESEAWMPVPFILTTFGLFVSLGANLYLGWLAWSFFWRYRQSADDMERMRNVAAANRQAA